VTSCARVLLFVCAVGAACSNGTLVSLGDARPPLYHFGTPRELTELGTTFANENPTLTGDLLDLFFTSSRGLTNGDVWTAHRSAPAATFDPAVRVDDVSTTFHETSSAISLDGLTLFLGSDRTGGLGDFDVWRSTRPTRTAAWAAPEDVVELNTAAKDVPRPLGQGERVMPLSSERDTPGAYQTFLAARPLSGGSFAPPAPIVELTFPDSTTVDACLSGDGLTMFFAWSPVGGKLDLYVAWRETTAALFSLFVPLDELNTPGDDRDPWLSPDGKTFFFTSDRSGVSDIYEVSVTRGPSGGR
jgi:WD40-like Beta Propeller Repeat